MEFDFPAEICILEADKTGLDLMLRHSIDQMSGLFGSVGVD